MLLILLATSNLFYNQIGILRENPNQKLTEGLNSISVVNY